MLKQVRHAIRIFDVFGVPIRFNFDGKENYTSFFGGMCTIITLFLIVVCFQSQIRGFQSKDTIFVEMSQGFSSDPQALTLNSKNFKFAVKIEQQTNSSFAKQPYFTISVDQYNVTNGIKPQPHSIGLEPCTLEYFERFDNDNMEETFQRNSMNDFLCPTTNSTMYLQGAYISTQFNYIKLQVNKCNGYTNLASWNVSCAAQTEIDKYLADKGSYRIVLYTSNYVVNPQKNSNYYEAYLAEDLNFLFQPQQKSMINVFFKDYEVNTDESLFLDQNIVTNSFIYREQGKYTKEISQESRTDSQTSPITIYLRSDSFSNTAQRRYMKVDQLFAYFGGIFNIFFIIFGIFVTMYNSTFYKLQMANRLYDFVDLADNKDKPELEIINDTEKLKAKGYRSKLDYLYSCFKKLLAVKVKIYPNIQYILYLVTFRKKFVTNLNLLVDRSLAQIESDMNVKLLMKKIQEIDKMKSLIFNTNQQRLFRFMHRPQLSILDKTKLQFSESEITNTNSRKAKKQNEKQFIELADAYNELKHEQTLSNADSEIAKKLIQQIGEEMEQVFMSVSQIDKTNFKDQLKQRLQRNEQAVLIRQAIA